MSDLSKTACEDFCQELTGSRDTSFARTYNGEPSSRVIAASENLTLMADISPLCIGHLLLVSNYHYYSYAEVCRDHLDEVTHITDQVLTQYSSTFGDPVILEHGSSLGSGISSCISHAHWHYLPISADSVSEVMAEDGLCPSDLKSLAELTQITRQQIPYYFVANAAYRRIYHIDRVIRQQYLRSVAGSILGIPDPLWDWALVTRRRYLQASMIAAAHWRLDK